MMRSNVVSSSAILVTGGAGYVGAHACKALASAGYMPVVFDNLSTGHESFVRWGPFVHGRHQRYRRTFAMPFAPTKSTPCSTLRPPPMSASRLPTRRNITTTMSQGRCRCCAPCSRPAAAALVFSSSCAIYGEPEQIPIGETAPQASGQPLWRLEADDRAHTAATTPAPTDCNPLLFRYFNASGADPDGEVGELRDPETHLIPRAMMAIQGHLDDFAVFGSDYPTPDGTAIRDYIHVSDLADAHVAALRRLLAGKAERRLQSRHRQRLLGEAGARGHRRRDRRELTDPSGAAAGRRPTCARRRCIPKPQASSAGTRDCSDLKTIVHTAWAWHRRAHPKRATHNAQ